MKEYGEIESEIRFSNFVSILIGGVNPPKTNTMREIHNS
jgi:hypothetical protein